MFCLFFRGFLGSDISSNGREQMPPSVTALYNLSFLSTMGHLNWLNRVVSSRDNKFMPNFCHCKAVKPDQ